ncbi:hypothetical protein CBM2589_A70137 [Cupriavidus taiwanensis]|uniref:Uncharacterized protein n=1 Tax=Cupriavidus taiwanensis TaxID=164546 RepID=A0A976A6D1_9BURK|nr:hypothetical protein CBM2589_A70137 [Cupriavidus taiwanensis]
MARRHVDAPGERLDVQRLGVVAVNAIAHAAQAGQVTQDGIGGGGHRRILPSPRGLINLAQAPRGNM